MSGLSKENTIKNNIEMRRIILFFAIVLLGQVSYGQCNSWEGITSKDDAETAHTIYRGALKSKDFKTAWENWEKAYSLAPAADGKRDYHYLDGVELYKQKLSETSEDAAKTEIKEKIVSLFDEAIACYEAGGITPSKCTGNPECVTKKIGYVYGRKGFDMFYTLNSPYSTNLVAFEKSLELAGNEAEYIVFDPVASIVVYQFKNGRMEKDQAVRLYEQMEVVAEHNIANNSKYGSYYEQAWKAAQGKYAEIEQDIFDCAFFTRKLKPAYEADPDNYDNIKTLIVKLKRGGCTESDAFLGELDGKWKSYAAKINAERQAEFEANNPGVMANKLYKEGKYEEAIAKYREALEAETDPMKKAGYHSSIASILFRKLKRYSDARREANKALEYRPGWGKPINLIGDMYATGARSCGDAWNQRLAIIAAIDKYNVAKKDPEFAEEAAKKIAKYRSSLPAQDDGFMRGVKKGDRVKVDCWIGETVTVRFQ